MIDLTGKKFARLLVIRFSHKKKSNAVYWIVKCDCGTEKTVNGGSLRYGAIKSCGCLKRDYLISMNIRRTKHSMTQTTVYRSWAHMKERCLNPNDKRYERYGARGITVCKPWLSFENFYQDMGDKPRGLTLERINNNGNYELSNCKWATKLEQANNRSNNIVLTYNGTTLNLAQWAKKLKIKFGTLCYRVNKGWSIEKALNTPIKKYLSRMAI